MKKTAKTNKKIFPLQPIGDKVIVKEDKPENSGKTNSGIYIPETVKEDRGSKRGLVVAVGDGKVDDGKVIPMKVKVGDRIIFGWGDQVSFEGEDYFVIRESEISAIIR